MMRRETQEKTRIATPYAPSLRGTVFYTHAKLELSEKLTEAYDDVREGLARVKELEVSTTSTTTLGYHLKQLFRARKKAADATGKLREFADGVSLVAINTIRAWASSRGSPFPSGISYRREGAIVSVGTGWKERHVTIPNILNSLPEEIDELYEGDRTL